jgi:hypothetical protein
MACVTWQGTNRELARLERVLSRNCECVDAMLGLPPCVCPAHAMLQDQSTLDHLLYVYRMRKVFITREFYALPGSRSTADKPVFSPGRSRANSSMFPPRS